MVEHQHWLDMGNHKAQPGQEKPRRAQTSPGKGSSGAGSCHGSPQVSKEPARAGRKQDSWQKQDSRLLLYVAFGLFSMS